MPRVPYFCPKGSAERALSVYIDKSKPEVDLLRGVDGAGGRQRNERVDGVEEALLFVRLQDEDRLIR